MKQVVFAIALLAMASLTGCLNTNDTSVDDTTDDTTSDNNGNTNDDGTIEPVGQSGGYSPPETANMTVYVEGDSNVWVSKKSHQIQTSCIIGASSSTAKVLIYDSDDRIIFIANSQYVEGAYYDSHCSSGLRIDITLGPEPAKIEFDGGTNYESGAWIATF